MSNIITNNNENNNDGDVDNDSLALTAKAELKKEEGNKAFQEEKYNDAINLYSEAIKLDNKNHIYYSNRAMCYISIKNYEKAADDAKECLKINPSFLKAYYRLSIALIELGDLDGAYNATKQGLSIDTNNIQLLKQLRTINAAKKQKKTSAAATKSTSPSDIVASLPSGSTPSSNTTDNSEIIDLQQQFRNTLRDYNVCKANIDKCQREQKIDEITQLELNKLSPTNTGDSLYRGIGKMFYKSTHEEVNEYITQNMLHVQKKELEYTSKLTYLEKRLTSQKQNIEELTKAALTTSTSS